MARNRIYEITYEGLWLGGKAIVKAPTENDAIAKLEASGMAIELKNVSVVEVKGDILYIDNGDY